MKANSCIHHATKRYTGSDQLESFQGMDWLVERHLGAPGLDAMLERLPDTPVATDYSYFGFDDVRNFNPPKGPL